MSIILRLFLSMLKIGCFAFGGGYAIIALLENEFIAKRKWIDHDEFFDVVAIAESTPGPIAINVATYVGYKLVGVVGAVVATVGMCLPSFVIMYLVSLFYEQFMEVTLVSAAFKGIQICVVYLIASAGLKMLKKMKKTPQNVAVFFITCVGMMLCTLFDIRISSVWFIFGAGVLGLSVFFIRKSKTKGENKK
ncbi:MAG: chromate transporter [Ruminococcaceae bacterium]|nr:chromate transporter [Oscillospiraceae bacterium]